jgi:hypothetical protein
LLELSGKYLNTVSLNGHYRSRSMELIDFSNRYFYSGHLKLLPDKQAVENVLPALVYEKIEGQWENQTNPAEAERVVQLVLALITTLPGKSIGIVTFNMPQQMLIMDRLESEAAQLGITVPSSLFVKNIENVQGDEKDIILFSTGYAPDKKGKMSMQFGSLNVSGGENRLNVAITRAREKIIIVSSIWPEDLRLQGIKNQGPKLLRAYLEYAREVSAGNFKPFTPEPEKQNADWYLRSALMRWNEEGEKTFNFIPQQLPFADLMLGSEGKPQGIILTDDSLYYQSFTAKEPHVYTPYLLKQKHWTYLRVFSRNWWTDRDKVEHELAKYMYQLSEKE